MEVELMEGVVLSCGRSDDFQLGFVTNEKVQETFRPIRTLSRIVQVAAGAHHTIALDALGRVFAWGNGKNGKLGLGDELFRAMPTRLSEFNDVAGRITNISAGEEHSACVSEGGKAFAWGTNTRGELGIGPGPQHVSSPKQVSLFRRGGASEARAVSCGARHTLFLMSDGAVLGCGSNAYGELGVAGQRLEVNRRPIPLDEIVWDDEHIGRTKHGSELSHDDFRGLVRVAGVAAGHDASVIFTTSGVAFAIGLGARPQRIRFKDEFSVRIFKCALSRDTMCLLSEDGKLFIRQRKATLPRASSSRGPFRSSQPITQSSPEIRLPVLAGDTLVNVQPRGFWGPCHRIDELLGGAIVDVACSSSHCCVVDENGRVITWGFGDGLGDSSNRFGPRNPKDIGCLPCENVLSGGFSASCGENHTVVLVGFTRAEDEQVDVATEHESRDSADELMFEFETDAAPRYAGTQLPLGQAHEEVVPSLADLATRQLVHTMDCFNFHRCWQVGESLGLPKLVEASERFILDNLDMLFVLNPSAMRSFEIDEEPAEDTEDGTPQEVAPGATPSQLLSSSSPVQSTKSKKPSRRKSERKTFNRRPSSGEEAQATSTDIEHQVLSSTPAAAPGRESHESAEPVSDSACFICQVPLRSAFAREIHVGSQRHKEALTAMFPHRDRPRAPPLRPAQSTRKRGANKNFQAVQESRSVDSEVTKTESSWARSSSRNGPVQDLRSILNQEAAAKAQRNAENVTRQREQERASRSLPTHAGWAASQSSSVEAVAKGNLRNIIRDEDERTRKASSSGHTQPLRKSAWGLVQRTSAPNMEGA